MLPWDTCRGFNASLVAINGLQDMYAVHVTKEELATFDLFLSVTSHAKAAVNTYSTGTAAVITGYVGSRLRGHADVYLAWDCTIPPTVAAASSAATGTASDWIAGNVKFPLEPHTRVRLTLDDPTAAGTGTGTTGASSSGEASYAAEGVRTFAVARQWDAAGARYLCAMALDAFGTTVYNYTRIMVSFVF